MIQALNMPYSSKKDEIMSRYRPIAPKPELPNNNTSANNSYEGPLVPEKFRQSPYLRNIWSHLQARPTRTRKRGRTAGISSAAAAAMLRKQQDGSQQQQQQNMCGGHSLMGLYSVNSHLPSHARNNVSFQAYGIYGDQQACNKNIVSNMCDDDSSSSIVELPLLSGPLLGWEEKPKAIDLNSVAETNALEERDLLLQLQFPVNSSGSVISPRPVRPVGSSINIVGSISEDPEAQAVVKTAMEVEEELEAEALPAVVSNRGNKVRMVNSSYKELVGQPECPWLDSMMSSGSSHSSSVSPRRISGEVMLNLSGTGLPGPTNGFTCWVRIEWESQGKKNGVNAFCDVVRLACEAKDYVFCWRFHTREVSPSGSIV